MQINEPVVWTVCFLFLFISVGLLGCLFVCLFVWLCVCLCVCLLVCLFRTECTTGLGLTGPHVPPRQAGSTKHSFKSTSCLRTRCALTNVKKKNACPCNVRHKRV